MRKAATLLLFAFILYFMALPVDSCRSEPKEGESVLVGRVSFVEGQLLRYVPEEKDWVATVKDAPFGLDDAMYSGDDGRAEFVMPNSTWARIGGDTQIQMITLKGDLTEMDIAAGISRFYNRSSKGIVKVTTPFGYVTGQPGSSFDLYVGDESVEVIALKGGVDFIHESDNSKYPVVPGSSSLVADSRQAVAGEGNVDADWDDWNLDRDNLWSKRVQVKGESVRYLPEGLHDEAYTLEENGRWERVYYEGGYRTFWRPSNVGPGWAPFTVGRWTEWYGDNCWIPDEPFGYVTHHYGNWVYAGSYWYWAPPVVHVSVGVGPFLGVGFGWYPGRVGWLYSGVNVGWFPLGWSEPYYCHRYWGPRGFVVGNVAAVNININRFAYINHAVVINQNHFFNVNNYNSVRITNINRTTIINNYHASPVVNNNVINNYNGNRQRYDFTNAAVTNKPHDSVLGRIQHNQQVAALGARGLNAGAVRQNVSRARWGTLGKGGAVQPPRISNKLVPANQTGKPRSEVNFGQRELKQKGKQPQHVQPQSGQRGKSNLRQGAQQGQKGQAMGAQRKSRSERVSRPGEMGQSRAQSRQMQQGQRGTRQGSQMRQDRVRKPSREQMQRGQRGTRQGTQMRQDRMRQPSKDRMQGGNPGRRQGGPQGQQQRMGRQPQGHQGPARGAEGGGRQK